MARRRFASNTVRTVGALIPGDVLAKALAGEGLEALDDVDYGLENGVRFRDAVNDGWNEAKALWWRFRAELRNLDEGDITATSLTRERWLLPLLELLGFEDVKVLSSAVEAGGTEYPVSHMWMASPLHLMGSKVELDRRISGIPGAARLSPHSLTQQFLNRSDDHLWGIVSNGYRLRILRDSVSLTRQAFVEFDLEAMFNGEVFVDFVLLYRVAHATRFEGERPEDCLLERWIAAARDEGIRALDQLREGVESALTTLGTGFLRHPDNAKLRAQVDAGDLDPRDLYRYLLRLVYRLLFLFVAEDRDLLLLPETEPAVRDRYDRYYSTARLRELASLPTGSGHGDLWLGLTSLMHVLGRDDGEPALGLPGLGSFLWAHDSIGELIDSSLDNEDLLDALQGLAYVDEGGALRRIDFAGMGAEELGSVYESLLELHPSFGDDRDFVLGGGAGSERKTTGSYYTPTELIVELLDSALDPVLEEAASKNDPEKAILDLKIVDPAVGSGHFLVAAAHRVAKRLAEVRTGEPEPPEADYRHAVRDVVSRCLFAVDVNDLAVELCKVSLWLEALEPGMPLSFLDHHILVGNSLFGATPAAIADGIPDDAFQVLTGDNKKTVSELKKRNRKERSGQDGLPFDATDGLTSLGSEMQTLEDFDDEDLETVRAKERMLADWKTSPAYKQAKLIADTWCAAFAIEKNPAAPPLTDSVFRRVRDDGRVPADLKQRVDRLTQTYSFFHWHLAFPQVFGTDGSGPGGAGWSGGFNVILGNPPWDKVEFFEQEWFAARDSTIAQESGSKRKRLIASLATQNPDLWADYQAGLRNTETLRGFLAASGRYPLCGHGKINTYAVFAELMRSIAAGSGRVGVILPTGIATDNTTRLFFSDLVNHESLVSLFDFENRRKIFPGIDSRMKFCLLTLTGAFEPAKQAEFVFYALGTGDLRMPERRFTLLPSDFALLNPNTRTCPVFRTRRDAEITKEIYRRAPVMIEESDKSKNPWGVRLQQGLFNMTSDSNLFRTRDELEDDGWTLDGNIFKQSNERHLPLYEAKMIHHFDHRFATHTEDGFRNTTEEEHASADFLAIPRYWVPEPEVRARLLDSAASYLIGFRDITNATNERTLIATVIPTLGVGNNLALLNSDHELNVLLPAILNSFVSDFACRPKVGGTHINFFIAKQLAVLSPDQLDVRCPWAQTKTVAEWMLPRATELHSTAVDLPELSARERSAWTWNSSRRDELRAELDAASFHLYGIGRDDVEYIMETFPIVKRHDIAEYGSYRTKELILDVYDRMTKAIETSEPYQTILDPPPADASLRLVPEAAK